MQDCFLNHKQKESRERWGRVAGQGEEKGEGRALCRTNNGKLYANKN